MLAKIIYVLCWPVLYLSLNNTRRARVIIVHGDDILFVRPRLSARMWDLPGGGIKRGEADVDAALREVQEELGISLNKSQCRFSGEYQLVQNHISITAVVFVVRVESKPSLILQRSELSGAKWVSLKSMAKLRISPELTEVVSVVDLG